MKSPITYYGGKGMLVEIIAEYVPASMDRYIEPCFGSGALFFYRSRWAQTEIINDLNDEVVNFFRILREHPQKLIDLLQLTPHARMEQKKAVEILDDPRSSNLKKAWAFFTRINQSFNGVRGWSIPVEKGRAAEWKRKTDPALLFDVARRLRFASFENRPLLQILKLYDKPRSFFYLDPPYLSVNDPKGKKTGYRDHDMIEADHEKMIAVCLKLKGMCIISGYDHPLYNPLVDHGWRKVVIPWKVQSTAHTSRGSSVNTSNKNDHREEILWISPNIKLAQNILF
jgi:DNA adenine methylase